MMIIGTKACIGMTQSDLIHENVRDRSKANEMWKSIFDVFEKHNLLNKQAAGRKLYTATMLKSENALRFAKGVFQLGYT